MVLETMGYDWEMLLRAAGEREVGGLEVRATSRKCKTLAFPLQQSGCHIITVLRKGMWAQWGLRQHDFEASLSTL